MRTRRAHRRTRFWIESGLTATSGILFFVTMFWRDWLEAIGFNPDHGDGAAEWLIAVGLLTCSFTFAVFARIEWRRTTPATT